MAENMGMPLYLQIKEDIKAAIQRGTYRPKEKIPPESALSEGYSVSRITVRRAVEELCSEGYLVKLQGRGTFVDTPRIHRKIAVTTQIEGLPQICANSGMRAGGTVLDRKIVPARREEHSFLGLEPDALLLYIQLLRTADGLPVSLEDIFLPYQQYRDLMTAPIEDASIFDAIEGISGRRISGTSRCTMEVVRASMGQAQKMGIPVGEPLFYLNCHFVDQEKQAVCIGRLYHIGSRYMFQL